MAQPALFGLVASGQPVMTAPTETPSPTSFLYAMPGPPPGGKPPSHIVAFLLPGATLPPETAAAIYLVTPPTDPLQTVPHTRFLGVIGPTKPSAIFKFDPAASSSSSSSSQGQAQGGEAAAPKLIIGINIEDWPQAAASQSLPAQTQAQAQFQARPSTHVLAQRIIQNAFNFLASFSEKVGQVEVVPLRAFEDWWQRFEARLRTDPSFLERGE